MDDTAGTMEHAMRVKARLDNESEQQIDHLVAATG